jgi:hypothetical protein
VSVRDDAPFNAHSAPSHTADSPLLNVDVDRDLTSAEDNNIPFSDHSSAVGGSYCDGPLLLDDSWIVPPHIGDDDDDGHEPSVQRAQLDCCTDGLVSSAFSGDRIPSENDGQGDLHAGDLNIDFDGEFLS